MVAGIGDADLDMVGGAGNDRRDDLQHMADAVVFDRQCIAGIVLKVTSCQVGADDAERVQGIVVEQGVVHPVNHHNRRVHELVDPLGVFVGAEHQIETDRGGGGIGHREVKRQGGGVVRLGLENGVDNGIDVGIAIGESAGAAVVGAKPSHGVAGSRGGSRSEQQTGADAQGGQRAVVEIYRILPRRLQLDRARDNRDPGAPGCQQGAGECGIACGASGKNIKRCHGVFLNSESIVGGRSAACRQPRGASRNEDTSDTLKTRISTIGRCNGVQNL